MFLVNVYYGCGGHILMRFDQVTNISAVTITACSPPQPTPPIYPQQPKSHYNPRLVRKLRNKSRKPFNQEVSH